MRLFNLFLYFSVVMLFTEPVWAHGIVGKRLFVEPLAIEDASINSEYSFGLSQIQEGHHGELELGTGFALRLSENLGIHIHGEWASEGVKVQGIAHSELTFKYVAYRSAPHEWIATTAIGIEFPPSSTAFHNDFYSVNTGFFYGKGFGDLPEAVWYLKPFMLQGDIIIHHPLTNEEKEHFNKLSYAFGFYYSIPYLQQFVKDAGIPRPFNRLFPMVEFNYERALNGSNRGGQTRFVRPGFIWVGKASQIAIAAVIPMGDEHGGTGINAAMTFYLGDE